MPLLEVLAVSLVVGILLTAVVRAFARKFGVVAEPRSDRWHKRPTALLGGIAIYATFVLVWTFFVPDTERVRPVLAGATMLAVVGLVDDLIGLKPFVRLVGQVAVAAGAVYVGVQVPWSSYPLVNQIVAILWLVGITNAINLLDNMDGLAAGITVISSFFLAVTFFLNGQTALILVCAVLAGTAGAFLVFNFKSASVFMGDCGSLFLGFMLGGLSLLSDSGRSKHLLGVLLCPVLILLTPIFDTTLVTITRKLSGRAASQGGKDHSSHRLVALGMSDTRAVVTLYALSGFAGLLAVVIRLANTEYLFALIPGFGIAVVLLGVYLGTVRVYESTPPPGASQTIIHALSEFSYKRRVFEILLDLVLIALAYYTAYLLRFESGLPREQMAILVGSLPLVIVCQLTSLLVAGVYSGLWRYAGLSELVAITRGAALGTALSAGAVLAVNGVRDPSRAVFVLDFLLLVFFAGASRLSFRLLPLVLRQSPEPPAGARPVLIYGAGDGGEILMRELRRPSPTHNYALVGFIDDDGRKAGRFIHGYPIFPNKDLPQLIRKRGVKEVLVSSAKVPQTKLERLRQMGVSPKRVSIRFE